MWNRSIFIRCFERILNNFKRYLNVAESGMFIQFEEKNFQKSSNILAESKQLIKHICYMINLVNANQRFKKYLCKTIIENHLSFKESTNNEHLSKSIIPQLYIDCVMLDFFPTDILTDFKNKIKIFYIDNHSSTFLSYFSDIFQKNEFILNFQHFKEIIYNDRDWNNFFKLCIQNALSLFCKEKIRIGTPLVVFTSFCEAFIDVQNNIAGFEEGCKKDSSNFFDIMRIFCYEADNSFQVKMSSSPSKKHPKEFYENVSYVIIQISNLFI